MFAGLAAATAGLVVLFYFINLIAQKLPLRPLFIITSAFLFAMAIKFIGEAVQEFQVVTNGFAPEFGSRCCRSPNLKAQRGSVPSD